MNFPTYSTHMRTGPLNRQYSRPDRWTTLLRKILGMHSGPGTDDPIWNHLREHSPFEDVTALRQCIRTSGLSNKHYPNVHCFAKVFCRDYVAPNPPPATVLQKLTMYFDWVLQLHHRTINKSFFSYNFLVEQGLHLFNFLEYLPYVKCLKCQHRRAGYINQLITLFKASGTRAGTARDASGDNRPPSPKPLANCHHSLSWSPVRPTEEVRSLARRGRTHPRTFSDSTLENLYRLQEVLGMTASW